MRRNYPIMMKRIIALSLCLITCLSVLASCSGGEEQEEDKGQYLTMYLTDHLYDLDPANAYYNDATQSVVGLLFDTLFTLDENGKVKNSLVDKYYVEEDPNTDEYFMYFELAETNWSDNTPITANDVTYAWRRLLEVDASYEAAALLFDIKNARAVKEGELSIDDLGISADDDLVSIQFEKPIDYDQFLLNLTSLALAPLREDIVSKSPDWAKKSATMVCSGPFKLSRVNFSDNSSVTYEDINYDTPITIDGKTTVRPGTEPDDFDEKLINSFVLERNSYYYRDNEEDEALDKSVKPYRIIVDCSMPDEDIKAGLENGNILYVGDIPLSLRESLADTAVVEDALSTHAYYLNENAYIDDGSETGYQLFANKAVRQALSMAIDREAIAKSVVFAEAATGLVPNGVFESNSAKTTFRDACSATYENLTTNVTAAKKLLSDAGISASKYSFSITVAAYDEIHVLIAEAVAEAWEALGFNVTVNKRGTIKNNDYYKYTDSTPEDICDDLYVEEIKDGTFEVVALDACAFSVDAYSVLAPYAKAFSGQSMDMTDPENYKLSTHITGYDSEEYNALMDAIYYVPYFADLTENDSSFLGIYTASDDFKNTYNSVKAIYDTYGITPSTNSKDWAGQKAILLREAEKMLMEDMPVIPILFNKTAYAVSDNFKMGNKFLFWTTDSSYYFNTTFANASVKKYDDYLASYESFLESKFDTYKKDEFSYFHMYEDLGFAEFKDESSNYAHLFADEAEE